MEPRPQHFLVIGGGASGVLMAVQLLRQSPTCRVSLFEQRDAIGAGIAYGTEHPHHLLNVPAMGMSAFADEPDHFFRWIADRPKWMPPGGWTPKSFVPRRLYRDYLQSLLEPYQSEPGGVSRLAFVKGNVATLVDTGSAVTVSLTDGTSFDGDIAILATGNEGPGLPPERRRFDCWSTRTGYDIPNDAKVAIIGTGLSMVDSAISLLDAGHTGKIAALSRRGLLPRPQAGTEPCPTDPTIVPFGESLSRTMLWLRRRVKQKGQDDLMDWRCVVDGLRPYTQELWRRLSSADKRRFLRHARPWWDVHRHRMAPQIRARIDATIASGQLSISNGSIRGIDYHDKGVSIRFKPRGQSTETQLDADYLIECRGQNTDIAATRNPLLRSLFERGSIRADPFKVGVDVTKDCSVVNADGVESPRILAIGPATTGTFWEIVAVPDIRKQVARIAEKLTRA